MRVVLDTNVVVSGLLRPLGPPARVLSFIPEARIHPVTDGRVIDEYRDVLARPRLKIAPAIATEWLQRFADVAEPILVDQETAVRLKGVVLPDPDDRLFIEVARSAAVDAVVTGNTAHFPRVVLRPVRVLTPRELLAEMGIVV